MIFLYKWNINEAFNCAFYARSNIVLRMRSVWQNVFKVDAKFQEFVTIIRQNCINNKCDTFKKLRKVCNKASLIQCELLMYALDEIVDIAIYFKK